MEVVIMKELLGSNDKLAADNREYFKQRSLYTVNLMGSPGSGKTTLISAIHKALPDIKIGVIEGDIASSIDTERMEKEGVRSVQINTCGECHLDAKVVRDGANLLDMKDAIVFIENVGNLICPAEFDLGENLKLVSASVPEGDDKPFKYVPMFSCADAVAITKYDLTEAVGFNTEYFYKGLRAVSSAPAFKISCKKDQGVKGLADFLAKKYAETYRK